MGYKIYNVALSKQNVSAGERLTISVDYHYMGLVEETNDMEFIEKQIQME